MKRKNKATAGSVIEALQNGPWDKRAHAWLLEVRDKTGYSYGSTDRYADALVVSCFPSRGIWFAGLEVKVDRADWKRELADPTKTAIQKWCDYWWVAAPPGVVEPGELPETWGLWVVEGGKARVEVKAPRLKPEAMSQTFIASVLRNAAQGQEAVMRAGRDKGYELGRAEYGPAKVQELNARIYELEQLAKDGGHKYALEVLRKRVGEFELAAGLPAGTITEAGTYGAYGVGRAGAAFKLAHVLLEERYSLKRLGEHLRAGVEAADELSKIVEENDGG